MTVDPATDDASVAHAEQCHVHDRICLFAIMFGPASDLVISLTTLL